MVSEYINSSEYQYLKKFRKYSPQVFYAMVNIYNINKHKVDEHYGIPLNLESESYYEHSMLQYLTMYSQVKQSSYSINYKIFHETYGKYLLYIREEKLLLLTDLLNGLQYLQIDSIRNFGSQVSMTYLHLNTYILISLGSVSGNLSIESYIQFFDVFKKLDNYWDSVNIKLMDMETWNNFNIKDFDTVFSVSLDQIVEMYKKSNPQNTLISTDISNRYPLVRVANTLLPIVRSYKALKYSLLYYYKDVLHNDDYSRIGRIYEQYICEALSSASMNHIDKNLLVHKATGKELYDYVLYDSEILIFFEIKFNLTNQHSKRFNGRNDKIQEAVIQLLDKEKNDLFFNKFQELSMLKTYNICISFEEYHYNKNDIIIEKNEVLLLNTEELLDVIFRFNGGIKGYLIEIENGNLENKDLIPEESKLSNDKLYEYFNFDFLDK